MRELLAAAKKKHGARNLEQRRQAEADSRAADQRAPLERRLPLEVIAPGVEDHGSQVVDQMTQRMCVQRKCVCVFDPG